MNFCRDIQTANELLQVFLGRFQLLPQHCPAALHLGFKFIVRYVHYHPNFPFTVNQSAMPFRDEVTATRYHQQRIESAFENMSKFTEESREHYIKNMVREDEQNNWNTQPTYDALLIRYLPKLLPVLGKHLGKELKEEVKQPIPPPPTTDSEPSTAEPLPTPTASTTELDQLSSKIAE